MKKQILLVGSFLLCGMALIAQNITMDWNRYAPYPSVFYQGTLPIDFASEKLHQNDVVSVRISGVANNDIDEFQIAIVNEDAPTYWNEMTAFGLVGDIKAGESFEKVVELIVKKGLPHPKLVMSGRNATLSTTGTAVGSDVLGQGGNGGGTSILLTLTRTEILIIPHSERLTPFVENWDGKNQTAAIQRKISKVAVGDVLQVTISGKSNVDAKELQVILVDGTPQANYWKELSAWTDFTGATIAANTEFKFTTNLKVTSLPTNNSPAALQFYVVAASDTSVMQVENFDLSIKVVEAANATKIQYKKSKK